MKPADQPDSNRASSTVKTWRPAIVAFGALAICWPNWSPELKAIPKFSGSLILTPTSNINRLIATLKRIRESCPGFDQFSRDIELQNFQTLQDSVSLGVSIAAHPHSIPAEYRAAGHYCSFWVTGKGTLSYATAPCIALCTASAQEIGR